jgi:soluble lytic murein transglycosylase-like protein
MTLPANVQTQSLRTTGPSRPGMRPPGAKPAPARNTPRNAFAQALAQANAQNLAFRNQIASQGATAQAAPAVPYAQQAGLPVEFQATLALSERSESNGSLFRSPTAPATTLQLPGGFGQLVDQAAKKYGVDPALIAAVMETESKFNPDAVSQAGARGLMQLMPATARGLGVTDASDPLQNILGGTKLLGQLSEKYKGNLELTLAAYNAGSGAVDKHGGIPPYAETRKYVPLVMAAYERFKAQAGAPAPAAPATVAAGR